MKLLTLLIVTALLFPQLSLAKPTSASNAPMQKQQRVLNLNQASVAELQSLSGIGKGKAEAIVLYRKEHGPFKAVDDITQVKGIGQKLLKKLRSHLSVGKASKR